MRNFCTTAAVTTSLVDFSVCDDVDFGGGQAWAAEIVSGAVGTGSGDQYFAMVANDLQLAHLCKF